MWDEDQIINLVETLTREPAFSDRDKAYKDQSDLCFQRREVSIPGIKDLGMQFRSPEVEDDSHAFKNRMLAAPVRVNVAARSKADQAQKAAQNLENFFYRLYHRWRDQGVFDGPLFNQASQGVGWVHLSLNSAVLPELPDYEGDMDGYLTTAEGILDEFTSGERQDLFVAQNVLPETMYWSPDQKILVMAAEVPMSPLVEMYAEKGKQITVKDGVFDVLPLKAGESETYPDSHWSKTIKLYTVETEEYCYHVIFDTNEKKKGHILGCYRNFFGTPGFYPIAGERTGNPHPLYMYRSLVNGKYQTVPFKNVLTTALLTSGVEAAQTRYQLIWVGEGPPPQDDNPEVEVNKDGVVVPPPGYELKNSGLAVGQDLPRALEAIEALDKYGYPKALNRPEEVQASSGYDRARQQDAVASLLDPPLSHFSSALSLMFQAVAHAVKELDLPVTVRSIKPLPGESGVLKESTLKPEDVVDADIAVSFTSITVFSRIAMQEEGLKMMQADQMNETTFQNEVVGTDNLLEFQMQRALDKVLKNADDRAVAAVNATIDAIAAGVSQMAVEKNKVPTVDPMLATNGQTIRSDRGPSIPIGAGQAMPVAPTSNGEQGQIVG